MHDTVGHPFQLRRCVRTSFLFQHQCALPLHQNFHPVIPPAHKLANFVRRKFRFRRDRASFITGSQSRVSFAETSAELFDHWTLAWLARAEDVGLERSALAALAVAERGRAQALLDLLRRGQRGDSAKVAALGGSYGAISGKASFIMGPNSVGCIVAMSAVMRSFGSGTVNCVVEVMSVLSCQVGGIGM